MVAKLESLERSNDVEIKMICVCSIDSLFINVKIDDKRTEEESSLVIRRSRDSEGENLMKSLLKVGLKR